MPPEIAKSLVEKAADRLESTGSWGALAVLALLFVHIFTFSPYLEARQAMEQTKAQKETIQQTRDALQQFGDALGDFQKTARRRIEQAVARTLDEKIEDFEALQRRIESLQASGDNSSGPDPTASARLQVQSAVQAPTSRLPELSDELTAQIRETTRNGRRLREILRPYIETHIIQRRFDQLNKALEEKIAPELLDRLAEVRQLAAGVREELAALQKNTPDKLLKDAAKAGTASSPESSQRAQEKTWLNLWQDVEAALEESKAALRGLSLQPPEDRDWWVSVQSKAQTLADLGRAAVDQLRSEEAAAVSKKLNDRLGQALDEKGQLEKALNATLESLEKQFAAQQKQIQSLGQPFAWLALDLDRATDHYPLVLSMILSAISLARSQRMRQLALALDLLPENDALWGWFFRRTHGTGRKDVPVLAGLVEFGGTLLWVSVAVVQIEAAALSFSALGAAYALPAAAFAYRHWVLREARRLCVNS